MLCLPHHLHHPRLLFIAYNSNIPPFVPSSIKQTTYHNQKRSHGYSMMVRSYRSMSYRMDEKDEEDESWSSECDEDPLVKFEAAVKMFNSREYYACHDLVESLWYEANEPLRTLLHALLQCSVAFHHLFNQNHKGAMMEMGEGVCKLRKLRLEEEGGPFFELEQQMSAVLNFIYQTQLELAACNEDLCVAMEQNERSYQLLEGYGAGQHLYFIEHEEESDGNQDDMMITTTDAYIVFDPQVSYGAMGVPSTRVKLPILLATSSHLKALLATIN